MTGHMIGLSEIITAVSNPAIPGRSRQRQTPANPSIKNNDSLAVSQPAQMGSQTSVTPYTRQSRTPSSASVAGARHAAASVNTTAPTERAISAVGANATAESAG